jgi:hypothetical protein
MMNVERTDSQLTLRFGRWGMEKFLFALSAVATLMFPLVAVLWLTHDHEPSKIVCERPSGRCKKNSSYAFGTQVLDWPLAEMKHARVRTNTRNKVEWIIDRTSGKLFYVANSDPDPVQKAEYEQYVAAMNAFFADSSQARFEAPVNEKHAKEYAPLFGFAAFWILFFGMLNGWRTTVVIDRAKSDVTISRRPRFLPFGRSHFPVADVAGARAATGGIFLYAWIPLMRFEIFSKAGKPLFRRRMMLSRKTGQTVASDINAVNDFVTSTKTAG